MSSEPRPWIGAVANAILALGALSMAVAVFLSSPCAPSALRYEEVILTGSIVPTDGSAPSITQDCQIVLESAEVQRAALPIGEQPIGEQVAGGFFITCGGRELVDAPRSSTREAHSAITVVSTSEAPIDGHNVYFHWDGLLANGARGSVVVSTTEHKARIEIARDGAEPQRWTIALGSEPRLLRPVRLE